MAVATSTCVGNDELHLHHPPRLDFLLFERTIVRLQEGDVDFAVWKMPISAGE